MTTKNMADEQNIIEALIFANDGPLPGRKIVQILETGTEKQVQDQVTALNEKYQDSNISIEIIEVAGGYQMVTLPEYSSWVTKLYASRSASRLTQRALETLSIIAYKQPITKHEMEAIRGVNVDGVVRTLIERNLITVIGREKAPGNPLLYGSTKFFLEYFGLNSLEDLPRLKEIDELLKSDEKFLESLDQVSLQQMLPEDLGIRSMLDKTSDEKSEAVVPENENSNPNSKTQNPKSAEPASENLKETNITDAKNDSTE